MELEITDNTTGEVINKWEDVFLGDFPLMTETGTFIINGAERVIVSQIVVLRERTSLPVIMKKQVKYRMPGELIPSRGTWLEYMTETKKASTGRVLNMSIDRKRQDDFLLYCVKADRYGYWIWTAAMMPHDTTQIEDVLRRLSAERDVVDDVAQDD